MIILRIRQHKTTSVIVASIKAPSTLTKETYFRLITTTIRLIIIRRLYIIIIKTTQPLFSKQRLVAKQANKTKVITNAKLIVKVLVLLPANLKMLPKVLAAFPKVRADSSKVLAARLLVDFKGVLEVSVAFPEALVVLLKVYEVLSKALVVLPEVYEVLQHHHVVLLEVAIVLLQALVVPIEVRVVLLKVYEVLP